VRIIETSLSDIPQLSQLHGNVFSTSIAAKLGLSFTQKNFQWYLSDSRCFLFHLLSDRNVVIGYCGGMLTVPGKPGSATSMIQFAFKEAVVGFLKRPWLLFHPEVRGHWPLMLRNIAQKLGWRPQHPAVAEQPKSIPAPSMGLVVIGVAPEARNQGVGQVLLAEFERRARQHGAEQAHLSVKKNNPQAHRAYEKAGWVRLREDGVNYVFTKVLS
jgi:ribosomal protein S18 acetylase RimI-like enzyme